jgi:hypothetical protein
MLAVAEVRGEILEGIHAEITLTRAITMTVKAVLHEQRLDLRLVGIICRSSRGKKERKWEKSDEVQSHGDTWRKPRGLS